MPEAYQAPPTELDWRTRTLYVPRCSHNQEYFSHASIIICHHALSPFIFYWSGNTDSLQAKGAMYLVQVETRERDCSAGSCTGSAVSWRGLRVSADAVNVK